MSNVFYPILAKNTLDNVSHNLANIPVNEYVDSINLILSANVSKTEANEN